MEIREFLENLCNGIGEIPKRYRPVFDSLQEYGVIRKKGKNFCLKSGYAIGVLDVVRRDLVFLKSFVSTHTRDFKLVRCSGNLLSGDLALVKILPHTMRARLVTLLHCPFLTQLVYLEKVKGKIAPLLLGAANDRPIFIRARQKAINVLPLHTVLEIDARNGEVLEVLGILEDEKIDERIVLRAHRRVEDFPQDCLELARSFGTEVYAEMYPHRKDLRHLAFCTIDPSDAKDHDDAIYFDALKQILYVAIADVAEYVSKDSALDKEARKRGFSVYLPHKSIPMLPQSLSENICSLKANEDRLALVWEIKLDDHGEVLERQVYEAIICNHQSLSYEEVDAFFTFQKELDCQITQSLFGFRILAKKRRLRRLQKGFDFKNQEYKMILDSHNSLEAMQEEKQGESHQFVEEAMLLANLESARLLQVVSCDVIYRVHEQMRENEFYNLVASLRDLGFDQKVSFLNLHQSILAMQKWAREQGLEQEVDQMMIRAQNQAQYSTHNIGHFGLGFDAYVHFTSPIRRYSDLCVHRLIKDFLAGGRKLGYISSTFASCAKSLSCLERDANRVQTEYEDRKFAHWARAHIGEVLEVRVVDEMYPPLCVAQEKINGARVVLIATGKVEKFEKFDVMIQDVDLANARIYASKLEEKK